MSDRELQIGDVIRCRKDGTEATVCPLTFPVAEFAVAMGWWVIVDPQPQEEPKQ